MAWPMIAMAAGGALAGALGGKSRAKQSKKPTVITTKRTPPAALGGYDRLLAALNQARDTPGYRVGANNPYLSGVFSHVLGRAGVPMPEGGWRPPGMPAPVAPPLGGPGMANLETSDLANLLRNNPYFKTTP